VKAALDTNIFISVLALPGEQAEKAAAEGRFELATSNASIAVATDRTFRTVHRSGGASCT